MNSVIFLDSHLNSARNQLNSGPPRPSWNDMGAWRAFSVVLQLRDLWYSSLFLIWLIELIGLMKIPAQHAPLDEKGACIF